MTAPELKPCPFCGGKAYLRDDESHSTAAFIGCSTEECFGEIHWEQTAAEAIAAWNTRADTATWNAAIKAAADTFNWWEDSRRQQILALLKDEK